MHRGDGGGGWQGDIGGDDNIAGTQVNPADLTPCDVSGFGDLFLPVSGVVVIDAPCDRYHDVYVAPLLLHWRTDGVPAEKVDE